MDEVKITIIGAGVVGLAIAAELSSRHDDIVLVERHDTFGQETSSRNSEVIHSGIYYPAGSLKSLLCVEGADLLYRLCNEQTIPCRRLGKLIVATSQEEVSQLEQLLEKGRANQVKDLALLDSRDAEALEPNVNAVAALYSPNTGIIDSHSLMKHFYHEAQARNVLFSFKSEIGFLQKEAGGFVVGLGKEGYRLKSRIVINSAGLMSERIAQLAGIDVQRFAYTLEYCKGTYFSYAKPSPVKILVYPVPHKGLAGLGVHATLDLAWRLRFGPDIEYTNACDYTVDAAKRDVFYEGASRIIRNLDKEALVPDTSGIRPKLRSVSDEVRDFIISEESDKGLPGLINLVGIESPGLTAAPSIARLVSSLVNNILA